MNRLWMLSLFDLKNVYRDPVLVASFFGPVLLAVLLKWALPVVDEMLAPFINWSLLVHTDFMVSFLLLLTPVMIGMIVGFIMLEERDEQVLQYLLVTPLTKKGYLHYRLASPTLASTVFSFFLLWLLDVPVWDYRIILVVLMSSLSAPMMALILSAFSANKVEGLAVSKACGVMFLAPLPGYVLSSSWQWIGAFVPLFWTSQGFLAAVQNSMASSFFLYVGAGCVLHLVYIYVSLARFTSRTEKP